MKTQSSKQIPYLPTLSQFLKFQNLPKLFTMTHIFNQIHTQKKRIYKIATNHPTHLIPLSPKITQEKEKIQNAINKRRNLNPIPIMD